MNISNWVSHPGRLNIINGQVQIWIARLDEQQDSDFWLFLSEDERNRAERFIKPDHASRFIVSRGILRCLLSAYLDLDPKHLVFKYGIHGKPALAEIHASSLSFNLSHSADLAVYGFVEGRQIGVDIEEMSQTIDIEAAAQFAMSPAESAVLETSNRHDRLPLFYRLWTGKEAIIKCKGNGLYQSMKSIHLNDQGLQTGSLTATLPDGSRCHVSNFNHLEGYTFSVAL